MRKLTTILAFLCALALSASAQGSRYDSVPGNTAATGQPGSIQLLALLPGSTYNVCTGVSYTAGVINPCGAATASIYSDPSLAAQYIIAQPATASATNGDIGFYATPATYTITATPPPGSIGTVQTWAITLGPTTAQAFSVSTPAPGSPATVTASVVGTAGSTTYYYWIVSNFTIGNSAPSASVAVTTAPATLSSYNYVQLTWDAVTGANSYDVLRTTTNTAPTGACNCAVATAVSGTTQNDQADALNTYTVATYAGNTTFNITNVASGAAESKLTFAADHGTQFTIDNINGASFTNINSISPTITPTSIETIEYADQHCATASVYDQTCITNAAAALPSGGIVWLSKHTYTISSTVTVPNNVTIAGGWRYPGNTTINGPTNGGTGPLLDITVGSGGTTTPAFIMNSGSGLQGVEMYWPNQSTTSTPVQYGWAITSTGTVNDDKVVLRDLMLVNPYLGILQNNGGQWELDNIYGTPISVGLRLDQVYDGTDAHNIHFWTSFWTTGAINTYIQNNGIGIDLQRVDGLNLSGLEVFGYHIGVEATSDGTNGGPWANISNFLVDGTQEPFYISSAQQLQIANGSISGGSVAGEGWGITTGSSIGLRANVSVSNVTVYALFGGADITSSTGTFNFVNFAGRSGSDGSYETTGTGDLIGPLVDNESTAVVNVSGSAGISPANLAARVWGAGPQTSVDGVVFPTSGTDATPATWAATFDKTFNLTSAVGGIEDSTFIGPGAYVFSGTITTANITGPAQFYIRLETGAGADVYAIWPAHAFAVQGVPAGQAVAFSVPFIVGANASVVAEVVFGGGTTGTATISGLSLHDVSAASPTYSEAELLYGGVDYLDPTNAGLWLYGATVDANKVAQGGVGVFSADLNSSAQVVSTHLSSALPVAQGGTGATTLAGAGIALSGANGLSAGTVTLAAGAGSHTFTAAYSAAPVCTATDMTAPDAAQATSSTTVVTLAGTGTDVIAWQCSPAVN